MPKLTNRRPFRSYSDINKYNQFLLELDTKKYASDLFEPSLLQNKIKDKAQMDKLLKTISNDSINNPNYTGLTPWDMLMDLLSKDDVDLYVQHSQNDVCNNLETTVKNVPKEKVTIVAEVNNICDLLNLIDSYPLSPNVEYNINMEALHKIKQPLTELNNMIGMKSLKENIVDQIIFYIQNINNLEKNTNDFMHTVIYGPPGTGKTEIAKIIGTIFANMGILTKGTFKKVCRADLIAGYLGQTALKTREVIKEALGGVLFIDEAYALGNEEKRDSFAKECIDTLCEALSDHKNNLMVIVAGYESDLNNCFFNYNQGLDSRFAWRFKTDEYSAEDLFNIFLKKVADGNWFIANDSGITAKWFEKHKKHFKFYGRDIETLFAKTKIMHYKRVFCLEESVKRYIVLKDLDKGLELFLKNEDTKEREREKTRSIMSSMYI